MPCGGRSGSTLDHIMVAAWRHQATMWHNGILYTNKTSLYWIRAFQSFILFKSSVSVFRDDKSLHMSLQLDHMSVITLRLRLDGCQFPDNIFKCLFLNENVRILIKISLKSVPKDSINNIPVLVQIMAWRRQGDKPLSEPVMVRLPILIYVTQPQWVKASTGN